MPLPQTAIAPLLELLLDELDELDEPDEPEEDDELEPLLDEELEPLELSLGSPPQAQRTKTEASEIVAK